VPAPPELLQRHGEIRRMEIDRKMETQQQCATDRDIRIGRKIAINLQRIRIHAEQQIARAVVFRHGKDGVGKMLGQPVGHDHFFEQPAQDERRGTAGVKPHRPVGEAAHLRQEI